MAKFYLKRSLEEESFHRESHKGNERYRYFHLYYTPVPYVTVRYHLAGIIALNLILS